MADANGQKSNFASSRLHATQELDEIDEDPAVNVAQIQRGHMTSTQHMSMRPSHLMPDYGCPSDAKNIPHPAHHGHRSEPRPVVSGKRSIIGAFKPRDTLRQGKGFKRDDGPGGMQTVSVHASPMFDGSQYQQPLPFRKEKHLTTTSSRGSNVASRASTWTDAQGDGFQEGPVPSTKRQKVSHTPQKDTSVDLTQDELDELNAEAALHYDSPVRGRRFVSTLTDRKPGKPFENVVPEHELEQTKAAKKPRKRKPSAGDTRSSFASSKAASVEVNYLGVQQAATDDVIVIPDSLEDVESGRPAAKRRRQVEQSQKPDIDLMRNLPPLTPPGRKGLRTVVDGGLRHSPDVELISTRATPSAVKKPTRRTIPQDNVVKSNKKPLRRSPPHDESGDTRTAFVRDVQSPEPQHKIKALQRMQPQFGEASGRSRNSIDESVLCVDELQGITTVASALPKVPTNQKRSASTSSSSLDGRVTHARRSPSLSDITSTAFKYGKTPTDELGVDAVSSGDILPIEAFYTASAVCCSGNVALVFQNHELNIYVDGEPVRVPGQQKLASIGESEARQVFHNGKSRIVWIKGSRTSLSDGHIFVKLKTGRDFRQFVDQIIAATNDKVAFECEDSIKLEAVYNKQIVGIAVTNEKRQRQVLYQESAMRQHGTGMGPRQSDDEEEIKYDDNSDGDVKPSCPLERKSAPGSRFELTENKKIKATTAKSPYFEEQPVAKRSTRTTRQIAPRAPSPSPERWSRTHNPPRWSHPVTYPAEGARRVTIDFQDIERLDEGEFLNDNVLSFALRRIEENMDEKYKQEVQFFNTFFYSALTTKNGKKMFNYDGIKRWTKTIDIFTKPYVVVPINIDLHWFVAIICNLPNLERDSVLEAEGKEDSQAVELQEVDGRDVDESEGADEDAVTSLLADKTQVAAGIDQLSIEDDQEHIAHGSGRLGKMVARNEERGKKSTRKVSRTSTGSSAKGKKKAPTPRKFNPDDPCIITLDSLGSAHSAEVRNIKDYLAREAEEKRGMSIGRDDLQGVTAKGIPEQSNFCDCGVYVAGYVEQFAKDPRKFITQLLMKDMDGLRSGFTTFDPSARRIDIRNDLLELNAQQEAARKMKRKKRSDTPRVDDALQPSQVAPKPVSWTPREVAAKVVATPFSAEVEATKILAVGPGPEIPNRAAGNHVSANVKSDGFEENEMLNTVAERSSNSLLDGLERAIEDQSPQGLAYLDAGPDPDLLRASYARDSASTSTSSGESDPETSSSHPEQTPRARSAEVQDSQGPM